MEVSKAQFKPKALEYFRRIQETGEELVVTDHGRPAIRISRYRDGDRDPFRALRGSVKRFDDPESPVAVGDWDSAG
jgi:antitoxin (DNA-binding transcriptional repressor) of toxin-antitoxin stability system